MKLNMQENYKVFQIDNFVVYKNVTTERTLNTCKTELYCTSSKQKLKQYAHLLPYTAV